jgi:hypothetical protein
MTGSPATAAAARADQLSTAIERVPVDAADIGRDDDVALAAPRLVAASLQDQQAASDDLKDVGRLGRGP